MRFIQCVMERLKVINVSAIHLSLIHIYMAVGVIIGSAFGKIVSSLVNDIIMPIVTLMTGATDFSGLSIVLKEPVDGSQGISLMYGSFLQNVIDFLIIALVIFLMLKFIVKISSLRQKEEKEDMREEKGPTTEDVYKRQC